MSDVRRIFRWEISIDDQDHELDALGPVVHVAGHRHFVNRVEFWTVDPSDEQFWNAPIGTREHTPPPQPQRKFRVFGTGQSIPAGYMWRGTAPRTVDGYVWHLFERADEADDRAVTVRLQLAGDRHFALEDVDDPVQLLVRCWCGATAKVRRDDEDLADWPELPDAYRPQAVSGG